MPPPLRSILAVLVFGSLSNGCFKATFVADPASVDREPTYEEWTDFYVFGLVGDERIDASRTCPGGVARVRTGANFVTGLVSVVTIGIYTPRKVYLTCYPPPLAPPLGSTPWITTPAPMMPAGGSR